METQWNFKKELARKFTHLLSVFIIIIYFIVSYLFNKQIALLLLVLILIVSLEFEYLRLEIPRKIPVLNRVWSYIRREKEKDRLGADIFILTGAILVLAIFDTKVAVAAILMTTFGDLAAALIGIRFGKHYLSFLKDRAWEGILAEFFVDLLIGFVVFFWGFWVDLSLVYNLYFWLVVLVMSITATFVETIVYTMDDNFIIPVFAGFNGQVVLLLGEWFGVSL